MSKYQKIQVFLMVLAITLGTVALSVWASKSFVKEKSILEIRKQKLRKKFENSFSKKKLLEIERTENLYSKQASYLRLRVLAILEKRNHDYFYTKNKSEVDASYENLSQKLNFLHKLSIRCFEEVNEITNKKEFKLYSRYYGLISNCPKFVKNLTH